VFRNEGSHPGGAFAVPLAAAAGLTLIAVFATRDRVPFLFWLTLLLVAHAAALQLIRAGGSVGYQHFVSPASLLVSPNTPWTAIVALQIAAVAVALPRALRLLMAKLSAPPAGWRIVLVLGIVFAAGAAASRDLVFFAAELGLAFVVQLAAIANALILMMALPDGAADRAAARLDRFSGSGDDSLPAFWRVDRFVLLAAFWAVAVTALLGFFVYQWHPHVPDEVVYLLHAKYLAAGRLDLALPPVAEAFSVDLMTYEPARWYSPVPPGWPFVLAVGTWLGVTWLVNPLLSGLCVVACHLFVRDTFDERTARITTVLLCTSPWFMFLGMSLMTHQLTLAAALVAAVAAARLRRDGSLAFGLVSGACIGLLALIRPLEGFIVALLLGFHVLLSGRLRARILPVSVMAAASIATAALTLPYNAYFTGDPTYFPIMAYTDALYGAGSNALGFGPDRGLPFGALDPFPGHGLADATINSVLNAFQINVELLGWMTGSLVLIGVLLVSRSMRRQDLWMLLTILVVAGAHAFYWFSGGPDFGARYWYLVLVPCLVLVARGIDVLAGAFRDPRDRARPLIATLALCLGAVVVVLPWRSADKYFHYRGMRPGVRESLGANDIGRDLGFIRGVRMPDYMSAVPYGALLPGDDAPVIAWERDAALSDSVRAAWPDRAVWVIDGPSLTGGGYRIVSGPTPPAAAEAGR
jgi:4-amino-4-deoxy-L-arabinose transferase-like glycosyltransferase